MAFNIVKPITKTKPVESNPSKDSSTGVSSFKPTTSSIRPATIWDGKSEISTVNGFMGYLDEGKTKAIYMAKINTITGEIT